MAERDEISLGPAALSEATKIALMSRELIEDGLRWRWQPKAIARLIGSRTHEVVVARLGSTLVGFAAMEYPTEGPAAHLMLLAVEPTQRQAGLGRRLIEYLEAMARELDLTQITLEVRAKNRGAREFYDAAGYREVALVPGYYGRESAVRMSREL